MKKLILYLILLGNIFADEEIKTKYLSTNINILSGDYASINYGNITTNLEYNMSGRFSYQDIGYNNSESYKINDFQYQASIRQTIKKTTLGLIDKHNFIGYGIHLYGNYRKYDDGIKVRRDFQTFIFQRVIPSLKRVGLLTETVRPKFEQLGVLQWEDFDDEDANWKEAQSA